MMTFPSREAKGGTELCWTSHGDIPLAPKEERHRFEAERVALRARRGGVPTNVHRGIRWRESAAAIKLTFERCV